MNLEQGIMMGTAETAFGVSVRCHPFLIGVYYFCQKKMTLRFIYSEYPEPDKNFMWTKRSRKEPIGLAAKQRPGHLRDEISNENEQLSDNEVKGGVGAASFLLVPACSCSC